MRTSIVIRSRDEAPRLRLTLASLRRQAGLDEVVVIDDGSRDETPVVIADAQPFLPIVSRRHEVAQGRSAAANKGAELATGELLIFLDGDMPVGPGFVAAHHAAHSESSTQQPTIARGETWHLRCTRMMKDPETGEGFPDQAARLANLSTTEREGMRVTMAQVTEDFAAIERRAQPAIYPGAGPRRLYELEMEALAHAPSCPVLWEAASGSNQSIPRDAFLEAGGFQVALDINEHRELALRLMRRGICMRPVIGARSYHLIHRSSWRDPLNSKESNWEAVFWAAHPIPEVALLPVLWASLTHHPAIEPERRLQSLPELAACAAAARNCPTSSAGECRAHLGYLASYAS